MATKKQSPHESAKSATLREPVVQAASDLPMFSTGAEPVIYAGAVQVITSTFDFCLLLSQFEMTDSGARMKRVGTIFLTPGHAKVLSEVLVQQVALYEAQFGAMAKLPMPAMVTPPPRSRK